MKVDATIHTKVAERFHVQGYPTLKFFKKGHDSEYNGNILFAHLILGGRTAHDIVAWLNKRSGPAAVEATTQAALDKIVEVASIFSLTDV